MKPAKNPLAAAAGRLATAVVALLEPAAETDPAGGSHDDPRRGDDPMATK
jgi:hypothetical protein